MSGKPPSIVKNEIPIGVARKEYHYADRIEKEKANPRQRASLFWVGANQPFVYDHELPALGLLFKVSPSIFCLHQPAYRGNGEGLCKH